jgi:NodT family efflux transporter outer membrane factor (OMF) lipoprotein
MRVLPIFAYLYARGTHPYSPSPYVPAVEDASVALTSKAHDETGAGECRRRTRRRGHCGAGLILIAVSATGCAISAPRSIQAPVTAPASWTETGSAQGVTQDRNERLGTWWEAFGDPLLTSLVERAIKSSPDIRVARARLRGARAQRGLAAVDLWPADTASVSATTQKSSAGVATAPSTSYSAGFDASWELDLFGKTRRAVSAAQADLESVAADLADAQVTLAAETALDYVTLRSLQARLNIAKANLSQQEETLQLTTWRAQAGLTSSLDVEQSRANIEQTRAQIPSLETSLSDTEKGLALLLGQVPGALHDELAAPAAMPPLPASIAVGIPADTLRQRPDVRAAERKLAAEIARLGQAKAARYPSLKLTGSLGLEALSIGGLFDSGTTSRSLLAGLTAPILNRGRIRRQIEVQDAVREQAFVSYEKAVLTALGDVEKALVALGNTRRRREALASAAEAAGNAALMARQRYTAGLADFQTVLDTERSLLSVQDSLKSSETDGLLALIQLYKAMGGGWSAAVPQSAQVGAHREES